MILHIYFLGLAIVKEISSVKLYRNEPFASKDKMVYSGGQKNGEELARIIQVLNRDPGFERSFNQAARSYSLPRQFAKKVSTDDLQPGPPEVRVHLIKNHHILEAYVKNLRTRSTSSSSEDCTSSDDDYFKRRLRDEEPDIRRNAGFRTEDNDSKDENALKNEVIDVDIPIGNMPPSIEDQVTPFKPKVEEIENQKDEFKYSGNVEDGIGSTKIEDLAPYDWKEGIAETVVSEERGKKDWDDAGEKETAVENQGVPDLKVHVEDFVEDQGLWDMKSKLEKIKREDNEYMKDLNRSRKEDKYNSIESDWGKRKNKKHSNGGSHNNKRYNFDDNRTTEKKKSKSDNGWNDDSLSKKNKDVIDERPPKKFNNGDDWNVKKENFDDDWNTKKKRIDRSDEFTTRKDFTTKKKTTKWLDINEKTVDNDWSKVGRDWDKKEDHRNFRTTRGAWKQPKRSHDSFDSYKPRVREYHKSDRGGFQGRTPIPFVGRHGIYDEKK